MLEELWMEIFNMVQETVTKTIPKGEKKMQEGKVVVWRGFKNSWDKKRNGKGERERYTQLNAEFQRIARGNC